MELLIKYNLGRLCLSLELELSLKRHQGSLCSSSKLELLSNFAAESLIDTRTVIFKKAWGASSLLIISLIQIPDSFLHLFLTSVNSSRKSTRVIWSFRSHLGQFLTANLLGMSQVNQIQFGSQFYLGEHQYKVKIDIDVVASFYMKKKIKVH